MSVCSGMGRTYRNHFRRDSKIIPWRHQVRRLLFSCFPVVFETVRKIDRTDAFGHCVPLILWFEIAAAFCALICYSVQNFVTIVSMAANEYLFFPSSYPPAHCKTREDASISSTLPLCSVTLGFDEKSNVSLCSYLVLHVTYCKNYFHHILVSWVLFK